MTDLHDFKYHVKTETLINGGSANQAWTQLADYPFESEYVLYHSFDTKYLIFIQESMSMHLSLSMTEL